MVEKLHINMCPQWQFEMLYKQKPNLENLPEWGTNIFVFQEGCNNLDKKVDEGCWVSYSLAARDIAYTGWENAM